MEKEMREDKHYDTAVLPKSSGFEKGVYSVGCIGANFCWAFVASYITMYYTDCVGLSASVAGAILLISRFLDGLSDILCAWMFKKVHFKSGNKIRPWFLVSAPLLGISMLLMFHIPSGFSKSGQSVYAFLTYAFMAAGAYTFFCLAQSAIVTVVSYDSSDRARFTACGNAVINTSTILLNVLTPFLLLAGGGTKNQSGWHLISVIYAIMTTILIMLLGDFFKRKNTTGRI